LSSAGPSFPSAATGNTNTVGSGSRTWINPTNIEAADGSNAVVSFINIATQNSDDLIGTGFGFSIPSTGVIDGIILEINYTDLSSSGGMTESFVRLLKAGTAAGSNKSTGATLSPTPTTKTYGSSVDLWGTTWTPSDINNANFGAVFVVGSTGIAESAGVDFFRITVFYHNIFSDTLAFSSTAAMVESPANKLNTSLSFSSTAAIEEIATLVMNAGMSFQSTSGMVDSVTDIPGAPLLGFSLTAGMGLTAQNIISAQLPFSYVAGLSEAVGTTGGKGLSFSLQSGIFMNATVGGRPLVTADDYTSLVTSEHNKRPNFMAMVALTVQGYVDSINLLRSFEKLFDIDQAQGQQLDMIGVWVGISRNILVPLTGVYFAFNTTAVGFNQGTWFGIGSSSSGLTTLSDGDYLILLKAKIASNHWDGTIPGAYAIWSIVFQFQGFSLLIQDGQDMTMAIIIIGTVTSAVMLSLITNGYIALRPAGVQISGYYQNTVQNFPVFGFGIENGVIAGFNDGAWVAKIG